MKKIIEIYLRHYTTEHELDKKKYLEVFMTEEEAESFCRAELLNRNGGVDADIESTSDEYYAGAAIELERRTARGWLEDIVEYEELYFERTEDE